MTKLSTILDLLKNSKSNCFIGTNTAFHTQYVKVNTIHFNWVEGTIVLTGILIDLRDSRISISNKFNITQIDTKDSSSIQENEFNNILDNYITSLKDG